MIGNWFIDFGANEAYRASTLANQYVRKRDPEAPLPPATKNAEVGRLNFTSSVRQRRANYANFVERSRRADPAGATGLAETLSMDPIAMLAPEIAKIGLSTTNVADAYTIYWVEAWEAVHGVKSETSRETAQAVRLQAAEAILATPAFAGATAAQKSEYADSLLIQAVLIAVSRDQAGNDAAKLSAIAAAVEQGARASGLDLRAMTLTDTGFVPAQRTGAVTPGRSVGRKG